ncbi:MAG TPA: inositol monophosphatase family protein [Candidatus Paceibacterota bacterium]|nr:inositol monophosphatase family protein [Candidatus Pacearchaeota archaeon]HRZ50844.1 inositol monophosphatase family protein [Candidatus Paceibacterota bacterium]HSA36565.1 inositol monophosphatase family protein [Candidatus Paceibacterota bacterium]
MPDCIAIGKNCIASAMKELRRLEAVRALNSEQNIKTNADMASHGAALKELQRSGLSCVLYSEESEEAININGGDKLVQIMLDPIDGTVFYLRGEIFFCGIGILMLIRGEPVYSFVGDIASGDIYHCDESKSYKNGRLLKIPERIQGKPIISGWAPYKMRAERLYGGLSGLIEKNYLMFNFGGLLQAAKIADGKYDAWLEVKAASLYEMAGALIAVRAGAVCSTLKGLPLKWVSGNKQTVLVSRNEKIHQDILACFKGADYEQD